MRELSLSDITAAARAVAGLSGPDRGRALERALESAHAADLFRKRFGRVHPGLGNGTLAGVFTIAGTVPPEPPLSAAYLETIEEVIHFILEWKHRQNIKSGGHALRFSAPLPSARL